METKISKTNGREYRTSESGISYHVETPQNVSEVIDRAYRYGTRLKLYYGDTETGRDWNEENDTVGTIGRSTGEIKIPLLIKTSRSYGGGAILDNCIVKIQTLPSRTTVYQHPKYTAPKIEIVPSDLPEYSHNTIVNGTLYGRHKTERSAKLLLTKLQ